MNYPDKRNIENYIDHLSVFELIRIWLDILHNQVIQIQQNPQNPAIQLIQQPYDIDHFKIIIKEWAISTRVSLDHLKYIVQIHALEDGYFKFLKKEDERQISYFYKWLTYLKPPVINITLPAIFQNDLYIQSIVNFNSLVFKNDQDSKNRKIQLLSIFKQAWFQIIMNKRDISWLDPNNEIQIEWGYHYIKKIKYIGPTFINPLDSTNPYTYVISEIDALGLESPEKKQLFLDNMRRSWSQKKFRDEGKTKKPYHLPLTKEANKQLEFLSQVLNKSTSQVLESIIRDKYQEYIDQETGKNLY